MTASPETSTPAEPTLAEEHDRLWNEAVNTLTAAVRLHHPTEGPLDFADFLASALAAVAGNVGSVERLTAGRPGSWESDDLNRLLFGTLGDDPNNLLSARTEPVIVQLNVAQLVSEEQFLGSEEDRAKKLPNLEDAAEALANELLPDLATEEQEQAWETADADLRRRYAKAYEAYAQRFTAAVREAARDMSALTVPVEIQAVTDPDASWWSPADITNPDPDEWEDHQNDEFAGQLWKAARTQTGLPTLEEPHGE